MLVGLMSGTYSSIFNAVPLLHGRRARYRLELRGPAPSAVNVGDVAAVELAIKREDA